MLSKNLESYLAIRRAAGFELIEPENILRNFVRYASQRGETHILTRTAIEWASLAPSLGHCRQKLHTLIRFARHARTDDNHHQIPPRDVFGPRPKRRIPHIYLSSEISSLLREALKLGPEGSLRPHTYMTLFALLASTGIRISEALSLHLNDITGDGLIIRQTKFKKSRLIPVHKTVFEGLKQYIIRRKQWGGYDEHLFISMYRKKLAYGTVCEVFRSLRKNVGLDDRLSRSCPRLHDFRHTFAVRALEKCPEGRENVGKHMLALSTYLGHTHISDTYWYLETTPVLMRDISDAAEKYMQKGQKS